MNKLTVLIPCKNERLNIRPCVESVSDIADEVLVADSGSTDETMAIARELGCRIIEREYRHSGDFKNWAIPQARHEWVLIVDADERVSPELATEIQHTLQHGPQHDGYVVKRFNHFMGHPVRHGPWGSDKVLRLFRRDLGRYVGDNDHASVRIESGRVGRLRSELVHYTFWTYEQYLRKIERYSSFQGALWNQSGRRFWPIRMLLTVPFRFFHTYVLRLGFLDGLAGFQVCMMIAFCSFLKQGQLWQLKYGRKQPDPEAAAASGVAESFDLEAA